MIPRKVYQKLESLALCMTCSTPGDRVRRWRRGHGPTTDEMKPGYLLKFLNDEERKSLSELTSDDLRYFRFRPETIVW